MEIVCLTKGKLKNIPGSTEDKVQPLQKSGIYEISCGNCNEKYIGLTKKKYRITNNCQLFYSNLCNFVNKNKIGRWSNFLL